MNPRPLAIPCKCGARLATSRLGKLPNHANEVKHGVFLLFGFWRYVILPWHQKQRFSFVSRHIDRPRSTSPRCSDLSFNSLEELTVRAVPSHISAFRRIQTLFTRGRLRRRNVEPLAYEDEGSPWLSFGVAEKTESIEVRRWATGQLSGVIHGIFWKIQAGTHNTRLPGGNFKGV